MAFKKILGLISAMLIFGASQAQAAEANLTPFMNTSGLTGQPIGHYEFCQSYASVCAVRTKGDPRVKLTPKLWNDLVEVNGFVNRTIKPVTDMELFGKPEVWFYPTTEGDCEDFVLLKQRELVKRGWAMGSLLITVVQQQNGDGHAVLTVLTDRGDLVLDNLDPRIQVWSETPYRYIKRQYERDSGEWVAINNAGTPMVGSLH
jgi:predicted transglutaminase-like cysteine proteinase